MRHSLCSMTLLALSSPILLSQSGDDAWEIIHDAQTKIRLTEARFSAGTRRLSWLAVEEKSAKAKSKAPAGPEYLEFREDKTPMYTDDVVTYIPLVSVMRLEYEHEKKLVRVTVKQAGDKDLTLAGPTKYANINKFSLDAAVAAKSDLTLDGALQIQDGRMKVPFRGLIHGGAKPVAAPTGRSATVIVRDMEKTPHQVHGLAPLYKVGAGQKLASVLMFQKIGQLDLSKIASLRQLPPTDKKQTYSHEYEVTQAGREKEMLTLLDVTQLDGNAKATLVGLVGSVPAGYKLFPMAIIAEVRFDP